MPVELPTVPEAAIAASRPIRVPNLIRIARRAAGDSVEILARFARRRQN